ncbi:Transcription elongation factor B polypeptide 2 [Orchesella cincta]|uniref:Transcription elongation factor B polypeptide 2 n=1 Tax=Orchesella cincta TaxID=48709 RepID=A0A1D2N0F6_ORCCI|nr:Transcription elongation factor B polypeptide 2 [Orchesella cincta]
MGKSKSRSKGKKGKKGKKSKKNKKKVEEEPGPPPELNTFVYVRRKNLTLCLETYELQTVKELKIQVATILRQFPEDITLFAMLGKKEEEMMDKEKPKSEDDKKKEEKERSRSRGKKDTKKGKKERAPSPPKPPADMTIGQYGYTPVNASIFKPAIMGLSYRGDDGEFEKLDITPFGEFPVIPEAIKMHLRNYVPPPPPPPKNKQGNSKPQRKK